MWGALPDLVRLVSLDPVLGLLRPGQEDQREELWDGVRDQAGSADLSVSWSWSGQSGVSDPALHHHLHPRPSHWWDPAPVIHHTDSSLCRL